MSIETPLPVVATPIPLQQAAHIPPARSASDSSTPGIEGKQPLESAASEAAQERQNAKQGRAGWHSSPSAALPKLRATVRRVLRLSRWIDDQMHGLWRGLLTLLSVICGTVAPLMDYVFGVSTFSIITSGMLFFALWAFAIASLDSLREDDGRWSLAVAWLAVQTKARLIAEDIKEFGHSPGYLRLFIAGEVVGMAALAGLTWANCVSVVRIALGLDDTPSALRFWSGFALFVAAMLLHKALRIAPDSPTGNQGNSVTAATNLPAIVDLSEPLPFSPSGDGTPVHAVLTALSHWRTRPWPTEAGYQAALERHFQRRLPRAKIQREKWLGPTRASGIADIIVDDLVLIEVKRGFAKTSADRAKGQLDGYVQTWPGKPILLVIFDAPREAVFDSVATGRLVELHQRHPILTVRMPIRG